MNAAAEARPHVVVIDDEVDLCELISLRLEHHGYRVSAEHDGAGALELLTQDPADLMLLDLRLENENGLDVLTEVRKRASDLPIIILTAHGTIEVAVEATKLGAYGFLTKPFDDRELVAKIAAGVEMRSRASEAGTALSPIPTAVNTLPTFFASRAERLFDRRHALPPLRLARETFDRAYLEELLRRVGGNVSAAARMAGRNRTDFYELLHRYDLDPATFRS
jgi:DNA-binding NtrC family response regulator